MTLAVRWSTDAMGPAKLKEVGEFFRLARANEIDKYAHCEESDFSCQVRVRVQMRRAEGPAVLFNNIYYAFIYPCCASLCESHFDQCYSPAIYSVSPDAHYF